MSIFDTQNKVWMLAPDIGEDENTITILNRYIDESEFNFDKSTIKSIFEDLYKQACEVE